MAKHLKRSEAKAKDRLFEERLSRGQGRLQAKAKDQEHNFCKLWSAPMFPLIFYGLCTLK